MSIQAHYEAKMGVTATYRVMGADWHTLRYVRWLEDRLATEIKYGHRRCTPGNCLSSGADCPAARKGE